MDIRIFLFVVIIVLGVILSQGDDAEGKKRKLYVFIIISLLVLESGLRRVSVGTDTIFYYSEFMDVKVLQWSEIWASFKSAYLEGEGKDPGFMVYMKLVSFFSTDFNFFLLVSALIFFIPLGIILYRFSSNVKQLVFSFTLFVALFNIMVLSGVRQQVATGFVFMSFMQLNKNNFLKTILLIGCGAFIHVSALFFLLVPFSNLLLLRHIKLFHLASFFVIPYVIMYSSEVMLYLSSFLENSYYSTYGEQEAQGGAMSYIVLMEALSLFCYVAFLRIDLKKNKRLSMMYIMLPLLTLTVPLINLTGTMIRIGQYFTIYMMLLVPYAIDMIAKGKIQRIFYVSFVAALIFLCLYSSSLDYQFFWQDKLLGI